MIHFKDERFLRFDIHKDGSHKSTKGVTMTPKNIRRIIGTMKLNKIYDVNGTYKYYLLRRMKSVSKWYNGNLFDFYQPDCYPFNRFLFVVNKNTQTIDNIIVKELFDNISKRITSDLSVYAIHDHAIVRAKQRIWEVSDFNDMMVYDWFINQIKSWNPCHLKPKYEIVSLLNHNFETCRYFMDDEGRVYVVHDHILMTVHFNESERWSRK